MRTITGQRACSAFSFPTASPNAPQTQTRRNTQRIAVCISPHFFFHQAARDAFSLVAPDAREELAVRNRTDAMDLPPRASMNKQEALMQLLSSDPTLMNSFDDELLASITLASEPSDSNGISNNASTAAATRHTLIDSRKSYDSNRRGKPTPKRREVRYSTTKADRANVRLHTADARKEVSAKKQTARRAAATATATANGGKDEGHDRSNAATRKSVWYPRKLLLYDENLLAEQGIAVKSNPSSSNEAAVIPVASRTSASNAVNNGSAESPNRKHNSKKTKVNDKKSRAQQPTLTMEEQYEFGRTNSYSDDLSAAEGSYAGSSNPESSHGSNQSDDSVINMSPVSVQDPTSSTGTGNTTSSSSSTPLTRQKSAQAVMDHRCFVSRDQWVQKSTRRSCHVCEREFGVLRKRHSCRMCGEVICSRCSVFRAVNLSVIEGKCRICSCCSLSYRKKVEEISSVATAVDLAPQDQESTSSTASNSMPTAPDTFEPPALLVSTSSEPPPPFTSSLTATSLSDLASLAKLSAPLRCDSDLSTLLSSDYSFSSSSLSSSDLASFSSYSARNIEEELEAALKARQLEKEVEASRQRIQELEVKIQDQENQKERLSTEQQNQLNDARNMIQLLQEKLREQEESAREAAVTRDTICLTNLRQAELYTTDDDESRALKQKLKILERQLQQAGINVAEVIPYEIAKAKVAEIARRLQEIGSSEIVLDDKLAQAAARKEYYKLEQDMEKYNTALVMTDEYIEEERRKETLWEDENRAANLRALLLLRSAIPVEISRLSEQQLKALTTPSGVAFPADLAKRLKRTNVLQLLRVDPKDIVRMHPSVVEGYRTTGLTLLERRALHVVMQVPFNEWKRQQKDELSQKKYQWYSKLRSALVSAVLSFNQHCEASGGNNDQDGHSCKLLGLSCPVKVEAKVEALYSVGLGFSETESYFVQEIIKSDSEGAGEKALQEAQSYAHEMIANQRQRELKVHYKMNMRQVAQAMGVLEEMDAVMERIKSLDNDESFANSRGELHDLDEVEQKELLSKCEGIVQASRELVLVLAKRAGICMIGKRNPEKDEADTRSPLELQAAVQAVYYLRSLFDDIRELHGTISNAVSIGALRYVQELLVDVHEKNTSASASSSETTTTTKSSGASSKRVPWSERVVTAVASSTEEAEQDNNGANDAIAAARIAPAVATLPSAILPTSAPLFDAIRARRKQQQENAVRIAPAVATLPSAILPTSAPLFDAIRVRRKQQQENAVRIAPAVATLPSAILPTSAPLFDAIRARRKQQQEKDRAATTAVDSVDTPKAAAPPQIPAPEAAKPMDLLAAIRVRQQKAAAVPAATDTTSSA
ncbi:1-phosphatidylinositol 3-phosphate 5-kinase fab1, partial [Globisporangium splendens]